MNKKVTNEYKCTNRQVKKRRKESMSPNLVHDLEYTFADEYYKQLQDEYKSEYLTPNDEEESR